jgi:hypothetical protein
MCEATPNYFYTHFRSGEDSRFIRDWIGWLKPKHQLNATLCASMLGQEKDTGLGPFCRSTIPEPGGQRYARDNLGAEACHVNDNRAEPTSLQQEIRRSKCLL